MLNNRLKGKTFYEFEKLEKKLYLFLIEDSILKKEGEERNGVNGKFVSMRTLLIAPRALYIYI